jgi:predicted house-cleaning noncanonical NTP pyrophosphatase (MazG superfamily)
VFAATGTAGPVQCRSRRAHAIDGLAGLSGRSGLLRSAAVSGDATLRGKLVRDRIPEIILRQGLVPIVETASPQNYDRYVRAKLEEELAEYLSSGDVAELADLVEVCFAAAALHGVGPDELLAIARDKRQQRGGFDDRLVWMGNLPGGHESQ